MAVTDEDWLAQFEAQFDEGKPTPGEADKWRKKLKGPAKMLKYLKTGERYWYSDEEGAGFGSERRRTKA